MTNNGSIPNNVEPQNQRKPKPTQPAIKAGTLVYVDDDGIYHPCIDEDDKPSGIAVAYDANGKPIVVSSGIIILSPSDTHRRLCTSSNNT